MEPLYCILPIMPKNDSNLWALYLANDRSPRTRANAGELARIRANSARVRQPFANFFISRTPPTFARVRRTFGERSANSSRIRPSSRESARSPPRTGELFAKKCLRLQPVSHIRRTIVRRERSFAANTRSPAKLFAVSSPRTVFSRTIVRQPRTIVHHKLKFYPYFLANDRSPRTKVRHGEPVRREQSFAANDFTIRVRVVSNQRQKSFAVKKVKFRGTAKCIYTKIALVLRQKYKILRQFCGQNVKYYGSLAVKLRHIAVSRGKSSKKLWFLLSCEILFEGG